MPCCEMIVSSVITADCHHQEDVEAFKLMHMVGYGNPNPIQLFIGLTTLFVTGHLVFGPLSFLSTVPWFLQGIFGINNLKLL